MSFIFTFIVENPLIFILIVLAIYIAISTISLKNKEKEIAKTFQPLKNYIIERFDKTTTLLNELIETYKDDEKVTNELVRILNDITNCQKEKPNSLIKVCNDINYFVLNTALLRTKDYPELNALYNIEMFGFAETEEEQELEFRRKKFNELIVDYNHEILNPPNSIIAKIFGMTDNYIMIEVNEGKTPKVAEGNYVKIDQSKVSASKETPKQDAYGVEAAPEATGVANENVKKVCPDCNTEFYNSSFCPTCGRMVE